MTEPTKPNPSDVKSPKTAAAPSQPAAPSLAAALSPAAKGQSPPAPAPSTDASSSKTPAKEPKAAKVKDPHRWRKRFVRTFMLVILIGLLIQILLWAMLPWTLRRAARFYGLDLTCDRPDLYLLNSDAGLWHVKVTQNGQPVANVDYCRAEISMLNLLRGRLIIQRLEADGVDLTVQRNADGSIPLLKVILFSGQASAAAPSPKSGGKSTPIDLRPPVRIDALVLTHVRTHVIDQAVKPGLDTVVQMNLRLTDVGSLERPPKFSLQLVAAPLSTPLLDSVAIEAGCKKASDGQTLEAYFSALARGLHPKLLEGYLTPLGIRVTADGVALAARGSMAISVIPTNPDAITGSINLTQLSITADGRDAATMQSVAIDVDSCGGKLAAVKQIALADGTFLAERGANGAVRVAGFEFLGGETPAAPAPPADSAAATTGASQKAPASAPAAPSPAESAPYLFSLGELSLKNFRASFKDAAVKPAADVEFVIDDLSVKNITNDPAKSDAPAAIAGRFSAPGILREANIDGSCRAMAAKKTFQLNVDAAGIHPDALGPYFAMMGVDSQLTSAHFTCQLNADVSLPADNAYLANARLANVKFDDGQELLRLDDVNLIGIGLSPGAVRIEEIDVTGPRAAARREKDGAIWAAGFRLNPASDTKSAKEPSVASSATTRPNGAVASAAPATQPAVGAQTLAALPKIDIGRFSWTGVKLSLDDEAAPEGAPNAVSIDDAGVELTGLHVDFDPKALPAANPAHLHAYLVAPGLAGHVKVDGTIAQHPGSLIADLEVTGQELSAKLAAPYLKAMHVEPTLKDGSLHTRAHVDVAQVEDGITATVSASDFQLSDPSGELLAADEAAINRVHLTSDTLEVGELTLKKPRGQFAREEDGSISAVGFRLLPTPAVPKASAFAAASLGSSGIAAGQLPATNTGAAAATQPAGAPAALQPATGPQIFVLKKFSIEDGNFAWTDRAVKPAANMIAHVDGGIESATWGKPADPAKIGFTLKVDGIVEQAKIAGTLAAAPDSATAKLDITAAGLKQGTLASYLPAGMTLETKNGRFSSHVEAQLAINAKGGAGGSLLVSALDFRDGPDQQPLFGLESMKVAVNRIDIPHGVVDIGEISVIGTESRARMAKDGTLHAFGVALAPATQPTTQSAATQPAEHIETAAAPTSRPATLPVVTLNDRSAAAGPLIVVKKVYPLITLKKLDVNLKRFTLTDESRQNTPPIIVSDLHLFADKPIEALGKDAANRPATDLGLSLKVDNVIDSLKVDLQLAPFAGEPTISVDVTGAGIHGDGLIAQVPDLKEQIDASQLTDGQLRVHAFAKIKLDRFDPLEFPLDRAFDVDAGVKKLEFRSKADGPVLAGLEEIRSEGIRVQPADKLVTVKTLEIENIVAQATREKDGIHALGILLKESAPPATQPTTLPTAAKSPDNPATKPVTVAATQPAPAGQAGEIRVNKLFVSGIDFTLTDNTVSPPLLVPINSLDVDVRNFSTKAFVEARPPTRFSVLVGAGKVPLPAKVQKATVAATPAPAAGLLNLGAAVTGKPTTKPAKVEQASAQMEDRDLFSQIQADGELTFYPQPRGWAKASVSAFDLASLSSTAQTMKVDLTNGVFDEAVNAHLPGDGSMDVEAHSIFTDLELSEPNGGPIQKYLGLDAALDVAITALVRPDNSIDVPLYFKVEKGKISADEIHKAAAIAVGQIVGNAVASAPAKTANAAGGLVNRVVPLSAIFGAPKAKFNGPFTLTFAAGDDALSAEDAIQLNMVLQRMHEEPELVVTLTSDLTGGPEAGTGDLSAMTGDIGRARLRSNPSQEECRELINRLSRRKDDLIRRRLDLLGEARGDVASRSAKQAAASIDRLRAVERELSATEDALDKLYDLERPGANRQAGRRTRQAALAVANSRQKAIVDYLKTSSLPDIENRINVTHPKFAPIDSGPMAGGIATLNLTVKRKS